MASRAADRTLVMHIGMHKTATTFVQNVLSARRYDLLREGVLYPLAGTGSLARGVDRPQLSTRDGAQSGHTLFTKPGVDRVALAGEVLKELPDGTSTVLVSAEDFTLPRMRPEDALAPFRDFGTIKVVLVLRRQDDWVDSFYRQEVDQYGNFETRTFADYLAERGPKLLDLHTRFTPWRDLVGPESFHVLSYDDMPGGGAAIVRSVLEVAGVTGPFLDEAATITVPRYDSVRAIDTVGLRILNGYHLGDRDRRTRAAQEIYAAAPEGDIELLTPQMRTAIAETYGPGNERIEAEWFDRPVPGFRFGRRDDERTERVARTPSGEELLAYVDRVLDICEAARRDIEGASA